jgi:membrane protein
MRRADHPGGFARVPDGDRVHMAARTAARDRGPRATRPSQRPAHGRSDLLLRVKEAARDDNLSLLAAGVAFFALLALVPALVALVSLYGLFADPADVQRQVEDTTRALPQEARALVVQQLESVVESSSTGLGLTALAGLALSLWSSSSAIKHLIEAINTAYDGSEQRGFVKLRGLSLLLALGAIAFFVLGDTGRTVLNLLRWPVLVAAMIVGLAIVYRVGANRDGAEWRWVSWGAVFATAGWLVASLLFSFYTSRFGSYNETYGSLGAVIVLMLWLFVTALLVLLGAELDAEMERRGAHETTVGPDRPVGTRAARTADEVEPALDTDRPGGWWRAPRA